MMRCEEYRSATQTIIPLQPEEVVDRLRDMSALIWIDICGSDERDRNWLSDTFHFHPLALEDVRNQQQRAKVDRYDDYYFTVLRSATYDSKSKDIDSIQVDLFIGRNYLVTVHQAPQPAIDEVRRRWEQSRLPHEAIAYLFYLVSDVIIDQYFPILDTIGDEIDELDAALFTDPTTQTLSEIFRLRRSLLALRKTLGPLRDAFNELIRSEEGGTIFQIEHTRAYFNDVYDHILRLTDFVDTYRDMLSGSLDAYQSAQSNRLNMNMQRLTVAATVLATSTVITGFYGMNLRGLLINADWRYGGHLVLGVLFVVTAIEIWLFRRKGWI